MWINVNCLLIITTVSDNIDLVMACVYGEETKRGFNRQDSHDD